MENNETILTKEVVDETADVVSEPIYVDKSSLVITEQCIQHVKFRPVGALVTGLVFGVMLILSFQTITILLGAFILALITFVMMNVKDYPTLSIYPDYVLVYQYESDHMVRKLMYDDVEEWTCKDNEGKSNTVMFKLKTGEIIYKDTFQSAKVYRKLNRLMPEKESRTIAHQKLVEKNKNVKMKFKLPKFKWPFGNKK